MSIAALQRDIGGGEKSGLDGRIGCNAAAAVRGANADDGDKCSSSSSIGKVSESSSGVGSGSHCQDDSGEVQSSYRDPLFGLDALESSLPIRRGISRFYNGRSKSFSNLGASLSPSGSCKDLVKPDNPYTRKRKNDLAFSLMYSTASYGQNPLISADSESNDSSLGTPSKRVKVPISIFSLEERFFIPSKSLLMSKVQQSSSGSTPPPKENG